MSIIILDSNHESLDRCQNIVKTLELDEEILLTLYPEQAMAWLSEKQISVFVTEMNLDIMNCTEICDMVKMLHPETVMMLMTEVIHLEETMKALNEGEFFEIIPKPIRFTEDLEQPIVRAYHEHKQRKLKLDSEQGNKTKLDKLAEEKKRIKEENRKHEQEFSNICTALQGVYLANINHGVELGHYDNREHALLSKYINDIMIECFNCFVFYKYTIQEFVEKMKAEFSNEINDCKIDIHVNSMEKITEQEGVKALFSAYVLSMLCKKMLGKYDIHVVVDFSQNTIVTKAYSDLSYSMVNGKVIYNTHNTMLIHQINDFATNILNASYDKVLKGYNNNPFFVATVISK